MSRFTLVLLVMGAVCLPFPLAAQLSATQVTAQSADTHPGLIFLSHDDMMEEPTLFGGLYTTNQLVALLEQYGIPSTFFLVGCHVYGQPISLPKSSLCSQGLGDVPITVLQKVADAGFLVTNHTFSHLGLSQLQASDMINDVRINQNLIDSLGQKLGLKIFRCPGFDCAGVTTLNSQPDLAVLKGPLNADVGGGFIPDSIMPVTAGVKDPAGEGGDWWFYANNLPPEFAGYYYVRDIKNFGATHGVVVLLHTRTEFMTGSDGSRGFYPVKLLQYIIDNVPADFTYAPMDGLPGFLGNVQTTPPELISREFGSGDGQGRVVAADLSGNGRMSFCKARGSSVYCNGWHITAQRSHVIHNGLSFSNSWYDVSDPDWTSKFGSKFWLVDLSGDGKADLVLPSQGGLSVGYSNGASGFSAPQLMVAAANLDYRAVKFADINADGLPDVVAWVNGTVFSYINNGRGFNSPVVASMDFPVSAGWNNNLYLSAMQLVDLNSDGCADLIMRSGADVMVGLSDCQGGFKTAQSWSKRFGDRQNFSLASQNQTFSVAKIAGKVGLAAGLFTGGIVFQEADAVNSRLGQYRYIMDNRGFSGDPAFHPYAYATDVIFADIYGDGETIPVQVREGGLYASRIK